ncbi:MAG: hypothetical protein AAF489_09210 [Bacteroidota bacterium]
MKPAKEIIPHIIMVVLGVLSLVLCFIFLAKNNKEFTELSGIIRVIVALSTAAISIALPGFVSIETEKNTTNSTWPMIKAGGALAIFIIVYLFDPINGG